MEINEVKRNQLVSRSKTGKKTKSYGTTRFVRRLKSKVPNNSKSYNNIDMNKFFKEDIFEAKLDVIGETDIYEVIISFQGVIEELKKLINERNQIIDLNLIIRSVVRAFDKNDIYIHCGCLDFRYRFAYWSTIHRYNSDMPEMRPANITNPEDELGSTCKHGLLVLNKQLWIIKVSSVINNYIKYMKLRNKKLYEKIIYPALFDKKYEEPVEEPIEGQTSMFDKEQEGEENEINQ